MHPVLRNEMMKAALSAAMLALAACGGTAPNKAGADPDYEKLFRAATLSLSDAIDKALAVSEAKDCVVVNAEIEEENGKIIYSMELAKANKILEINFDVTNGSMLPLENEEHDKSAQAKAAKITVKQAIATATKKPGTQPIEASLKMVEGRPVCEVKVFTAKKAVKTVQVDAITGEVLKAKKDASKSTENEDKAEKDEKKK
jgi:uncharacterized membrane protein YkoI